MEVNEKLADEPGLVLITLQTMSYFLYFLGEQVPL